MKRDHHDTNNSHQQLQFPYSGKCGGCGAEERWFLHTVRYKGSYRRLCTNCLLKNHQGVFCPFCFLVYEESLPPNERVMCLKCPSISHLSCVPWSHPNSPPSFLCPSCSSGPSSNFSFFLTPSPSKKPKPNDSSSSSSSSSSAVSDGSDKRVIDKDSARALVAAAKIAATSMSKAANVARAEAERRAREAALAKKKAREALERLASCAAPQDNKEKKAAGATANGMMMMMRRREHMRNGGGPLQGEKGSNGISVHSASGDLLRRHDYNRGLEK